MRQNNSELKKRNLDSQGVTEGKEYLSSPSPATKQLKVNQLWLTFCVLFRLLSEAQMCFFDDYCLVCSRERWQCCRKRAL